MIRANIELPNLHEPLQAPEVPPRCHLQFAVVECQILIYNDIVPAHQCGKVPWWQVSGVMSNFLPVGARRQPREQGISQGKGINNMDGWPRVEPVEADCSKHHHALPTLSCLESFGCPGVIWHRAEPHPPKARRRGIVGPLIARSDEGQFVIT